MKVDKHNTSLTLYGEEGDRLVIEYDNRGELYREGATFRFYNGFDQSTISVFLENRELECARDLLGRLLKKETDEGQAIINGEAISVFGPYLTYANICEAAGVQVDKAVVEVDITGARGTLEHMGRLYIGRGQTVHITVTEVKKRSALTTRAEIVQAIAEFIGLELRDITERELQALSPNGQVLFTISLTKNSKDEWSFGGTGCLLQDQWNPLCRLGKGDQHQGGEG